MAPDKLAERYNCDISLGENDIIDAIGKARGYVVKGGEVNRERTCSAVIDDFRKGRIGRISLESPKDYN